jgi:hypothetical protein
MRRHWRVKIVPDDDDEDGKLAGSNCSAVLTGLAGPS